LQLVRGSLDEIAGKLGGIERLEAQGERRVSRGGAVLRTPVGELDARLETQLARAREVLQRELVAPAVETEE
jgi:flagellar assembly protein FliH